MVKYIKNQIEYANGFKEGYLSCSQVANDEPCPYDNANNSFQEGFIDGWNECLADDFENSLEHDD